MNQATEISILNWYEKDKKLTKGLRKTLNSVKPFITIRLGTKWADRLNPTQKVAISVSDNLNQPKIIGYAGVLSVKKAALGCLTDRDLQLNIGAKSHANVQRDMEKVYKTRIACTDTVTVIELVGPDNG